VSPPELISIPEGQQLGIALRRDAHDAQPEPHSDTRRVGTTTLTSNGVSPAGGRLKPAERLPLGEDAPKAGANIHVLARLAVSPREAAKYLGVGHDAIYQLLNQGRVRSVKLGRRRLIPMSELERFLADELA
jgi:excisionase family DNA binding protein